MADTIPLTGTPPRGSVTLGATTYEVVAINNELRFRRGPFWTHVALQRCAGETPDDPDFWHADTAALGRRWEFRVDEGLRALTVRDMPQRYTGPMAEVDENGRVLP